MREVQMHFYTNSIYFEIFSFIEEVFCSYMYFNQLGEALIMRSENSSVSTVIVLESTIPVKDLLFVLLDYYITL